MTNKPLFDDDEMNLKQVDPAWSREQLLDEEGIFFLKDICKTLGISTLLIKRHARRYQEEGKDPYAIMGTRKVWNHWIVRMTSFAPYYRQNLVPRLEKVDPDWTGNTLLKQKGLFRLSEVSKKMPFAPHQLRYQAKKNPNSRQDFGIWKDDELGIFVVDMEPFAKWIAQLWDKDDNQD